MEGWGMILIYVLIFAAMYFFLIRPNSKKKKAEEQMKKNITIGDEVTTIGGFIGKIVAVKDDEDAFIIETGTDRVKIKIRKWGISCVNNKPDPIQVAKEERAKAKAEKKAAKEKETADKKSDKKK
ncbi:MAG: preprotein translocase subunit YajC [Eubacteriales bacterium]|nr:preprotein translocase subunit YajC [Eubacteriales bacterium]